MLSSGVSPPTPDFYEYDWAPPDTVGVEGRFLCLEWPDGVRLEAFDLWLRENAVGQGGVDPATREGLIDPAHHDSQLRIVDARIDSAGAVVLRFSGVEQDCRFHPGWLRHVADNRHLPNGVLPSPTPWTSDSLPEPPTHQASPDLANPSVTTAFLNDLMEFGLARLRGVGADPDFLAQLAAQIGPIRATNFGSVWDVRADVEMAGASDTNSTANTALRLGPHTDLPTRETPPGFQFLHCIANTTEGGYSTMADGAALVASLANEHPDHYEALTTLHWVFFNRGPGIDHRWSGPIIDLGVPGSPLTLRAFYPVRAFPDMATGDIERAYAAMSVFSEMAADDRFQVRYPFEVGDVVGFDNRRVLHGRDAYSSGGHRHLRGIYIDQDDIRSSTRVANRAAT